MATCKPVIRRCAQLGDWVAAFGAAGSPVHEKLVVLMRVEETLSFDEYWEDERFRCKRPVFNKGVMHMYGDNIYHHVGEEWMQEFSHHSMPDGSINYVNLDRDTQTDRVLISQDYYYFGNNAIDMPQRFETLIRKGRNHIVCKDEAVINNFISYIRETCDRRIYGIPYSRKTGNFIHYKGE